MNILALVMIVPFLTANTDRVPETDYGRECLLAAREVRTLATLRQAGEDVSYWMLHAMDEWPEDLWTPSLRKRLREGLGQVANFEPNQGGPQAARSLGLAYLAACVRSGEFEGRRRATAQD